MDKTQLIPLSSVPNRQAIDTAKKLNPVIDNYLPEATLRALRDGDVVFTYDEFAPGFNRIYETLVNKVAKTFWVDNTIVDPLDWITTDSMTFGAYVETIGVGTAKTYEFHNGREYNPWVIENDDVKAIYSRQNYSHYWRQSVLESEIQQAFTSQSGLSTLVAKKLQSMRQAQTLSNYFMKLGLIKKAEGEYAYRKITDITDSTSARSFVKEIIKVARKLSRNSRDFNAMHVMTSTSMADMVLLVDEKYEDILTVDLIADTFNPQALTLPRIEYVESFGTTIEAHDEAGLKLAGATFGVIENAVALLVHKDFFKHTITFSKSGAIENPEGRYTNHFQHGDGAMIYNPFKPAVLFSTVDKTHAPDSVWEKQRALDEAEIPTAEPGA